MHNFNVFHSLNIISFMQACPPPAILMINFLFSLKRAHKISSRLERLLLPQANLHSKRL